MSEFKPTKEQTAIIEREGSAFISACPGAGKTRCIVERARVLLSKSLHRRGLAFLSFTNAAVSELQERLAGERFLPDQVFPHFVGTFDSFIWNFLVAPFGIDKCDGSLRLIPDCSKLIITPFPGAQGLRLDCFERDTCKIIPEEARKAGFMRDPTLYEKAAHKLRTRLLERGFLDFDDVRRIANANLQDPAFNTRLASILGARFEEIIVDEAQDCNPDDLSIIDWLRYSAKISTKVVCDPHQSIYGFRGGVSNELFKYVSTFKESELLPLTGNFRSSRHICKVVHMLRAPSQRGAEDEALGELKDCDLNVHVFSYGGRGVSTKIGTEFVALAVHYGIDPKNCRLTAKTRQSGLKAIGAYCIDKIGQSLIIRLADAVMKFHHAESSYDKLSAIADVHLVTIELSGNLKDRTYHQVISEDNLETLSWRGQVVKILQSLRFDAAAGHSRVEWVARAQHALSPFLPPGKGTIAQKLPNKAQLDDILGIVPTPDLSARTIHGVKGKQFQGVCVVLTTAKANGILTHLEKEPDNTSAEDARELYVAASRAQKLLVLACPKSQSKRLAKHIFSGGVAVKFTEI
ncbi:MAG: ATP-dependent helicase [Desulfobulbaceae bacterium]|nr:ATP-dependent helicase [Desulfobulbaceae bacterium]